MRSRTVTGGGVEIPVEEHGPRDAHPILLIHGFSQSRLAWTPQFESTLADDHRLVAMDCRGHGSSGTPADGTTEQGNADADRFAGERFVALDPGFRSTDAAESVAALDSFADLCVACAIDDADRYRMLGDNVTVPPFAGAAMQDRRVSHEAA